MSISAGEPSPEEKLAKARATFRRWATIAARPELSPAAAHWARGLARSAAAEIQLREMALEETPMMSEAEAAVQALLERVRPKRGTKSC